MLPPQVLQQKLFQKLFTSMNSLFLSNNIDSTHGMDHALKIGYLTWKSLKEENNID